MKQKIVAIVGPTASGKTALAIELAKELNGEIISCDSMQIYKYMNIGTAKPTKEEMESIPHHLIDIVSPEEFFSCADYSVLARKKIEEISKRGKLPIFCGGTGLYVDHVVNNTSFSEAGKDDGYRAYLNDLVEKEGVEALFELLKQVDPESAEKIHPNNVKRVIRALEIYKISGKTKTETDRESQINESPYDCTMICLDFKERDILYNRIEKRVDVMIENGLIDEVRGLVIDKKLVLSETAMQGIGYKEIVDYLNGICSLNESVETIKKGTRNYAKRQMTWFRRYKNAQRIFMDEHNNFKDIVNIAKMMLTN